MALATPQGRRLVTVRGCGCRVFGGGQWLSVSGPTLPVERPSDAKKQRLYHVDTALVKQAEQWTYIAGKHLASKEESRSPQILDV